MALNNEINKNDNSLCLLLSISKTILYIMIVAGVVETLNTPNHTYSYFVEENILFFISKWIVYASVLFQATIFVVGYWKHRSISDIEIKKMLNRISFNLKISLFILMILWYWIAANSIHVFI